MGVLENENDSADCQKVCLMVKGSTMLKAGRLGKPHFRNFRLSDDLKSLSWESPNKDKAATQISIKNIQSLLKGQKSKVFESNAMPEYESKSFSVLYKEENSNNSLRSLDIVCANRAEYEIWTDGLNALIKGFDDADGVQELKKNVVALSSKVQFDLAGDRIYVEDDSCDVYTWGASPKGTLGHGEEEEELVPRAVKAVLGKDVQMVACGTEHTMALTTSGEVFCWGSGRFGKLGLGNILDHFMPLQIGSLTGNFISYIACGEFHSTVVSSTGELYTFGRTGPWLGYHSEERKQTVPVLVDSLSQYTIAKVACGAQLTLALTTDNELFAFGENKNGQLGLGHNDPVNIPVKIDHFSTIKSEITEISCGKKHVGAMTADGKVWVWGANGSGQLGLGDVDDRNIPTQVQCGHDGREKIKDVKCGGEHSVILSANGKVFCFGDGQFGQLGVDLRQFKKTQLLTPFRVPSEEKFCKIDCGAAHTAAITDNGSLYIWGRGSGGRLGLGDHADRYVPTLVESLAYRRIENVSCGANHTAALVIQAWIKDEEVQSCMACKLAFSVIRRRHHCRKCGGVFCYACTQNKIPILETGHIDPVLVCDPCYLILSEK